MKKIKARSMLVEDNRLHKLTIIDYYSISFSGEMIFLQGPE